MALEARDYRGFNYSGSWGTSGLDLWQHHDHGLMATEVARGKRYFPQWNVARWWLSYEAFQRDPGRFLANFDAGLGVFAQHGIEVMPVVFNRWRDPTCDFGGVSLEHIVPGYRHGNTPDMWTDPDPSRVDVPRVQMLFGRYLTRVVGAHVDDPRIVAWDICNEPFSGPYLKDDDSEVRAAEVRWLTWCHDVIRSLAPTQPLTISNLFTPISMRLTEAISDVISVHAYYRGDLTDRERTAAWEDRLDEAVSLAKDSGKDLVVTETIWGATDDAVRSALIEYTLGQLQARDIGFIVHALHHSLVADLHGPEYGPVGEPETMHFINPDGSLRRGHDAFNRFA
ncbi:glycoside hydrolase 5 family protein [Jiangella endophytica]|uniref:hypothetical protein n=1 Tax=Jiangella endophytica TaxID=1623398 RepID=UPI000E34293A|nr:hypothetical protein [Jiangella endophytica]